MASSLRDHFSLNCLLLFLLASFFHLSLSLQQPLCHEFERLALMQFKNNFLIEKNASFDPSAYSKVDLWESQGVDCCSWEGITCDHRTGRVIGLDLESNGLFGSINSTSSLFRLGHLQHLNLVGNNFNYSKIPSAFGNLSRLTSLNLSRSFFSGQVPSEISKLSKLTKLDLSWNVDDYSTNQGLLELKTPAWKSLIQNMSRLEYLRLSSVSINSPVPNELANLSSLIHLSLSQCGLFGKFPTSIFELSKLERLFVGDNRGLYGTLPEFHFSNPLKTLSLSDTNFSGQFSKSFGLLSSLEYLEVRNCNFSGFLPSSLLNLTNLHHFSLYNNSFKGSKVPFLSNLTQLDFVDLSFNLFNFSEFPSFDKLIDLHFLDLSSNQIHGIFPSWLTNLTQLTYLSFSHTMMIQGTLPSSISRLKNLEYFNIYNNKLSGTVELDTFLGLQNLKSLLLSENSFSLLTKNTSTNNTTIPKLVYLDLGSCNLKDFPDFLHNQDQLEVLVLSENNIHGQIPKWLLKTSPQLRGLCLENNFLTSFEETHNVLPYGLHFLDLGSNFLTGPLPVPPPYIIIYSLWKNKFNGEILHDFCNRDFLQYLDLSYNNLSGTIPQCLGSQIKSLGLLNLEGNNFHGVIPETRASGNELKVLKLGQNNLRGKLPRSLTNCKNLEFLDVGNNQIRDGFPSWLGLLPHLKVVILRSNGFHGAVNGTEFESLFPELRIVDLSYNNFSGPLPLKYFQRWNAMANPDHEKKATYLNVDYISSQQNYWISKQIAYSMIMTNKGKRMEYTHILEVFAAIDLSCNEFSGEIPEQVGNLTRLELLNVSNNILVGPIPPAFNNLSGRIPTELTQLNFLQVFNVSRNLLTGPIPQGSQFGTFENDSFLGNPGLCGMPLSKKCGSLPPPPSTFKENKDASLLAEIGWKAVLLGIVCGFLGGAVLGIQLFTRKKELFMTTFRIRQGRRRSVQRRS